jgi:hypothetical protein
MVVNKISLSLLLIMLATVCRAQFSLGVEGGVSAGYLNTNITNRSSTTVDYAAGYTFDIPFQYKINNWFCIETAPGITQKNYSFDRVDSFAGLYDTYVNTYFQLPIMGKFVYGKRLQVFADAGAYFGYWLSARDKGTTFNILGNVIAVNSSGQSYEALEVVNYNEKRSFNSLIDNRTEFGWVTGIGLQYHFNDKYALIGTSKYYQSLTDQQKKYSVNQIPQYNGVFTFSIGGMMVFR